MKDSEPYKQKQNRDIVLILRNIFQPFRLRCSPEVDDGYHRQLLVFNFNFLPIISLLLYLIFFLR